MPVNPSFAKSQPHNELCLPDGIVPMRCGFALYETVAQAPAILRRVIFIVTNDASFMHAAEINGLFEQESSAGRLYVKLREMWIEAEQG
jgi:hypothetical protein